MIDINILSKIPEMAYKHKISVYVQSCSNSRKSLHSKGLGRSWMVASRNNPGTVALSILKSMRIVYTGFLLPVLR